MNEQEINHSPEEQSRDPFEQRAKAHILKAGELIRAARKECGLTGEQGENPLFEHMMLLLELKGREAGELIDLFDNAPEDEGGDKIRKIIAKFIETGGHIDAFEEETLEKALADYLRRQEYNN